MSQGTEVSDPVEGVNAAPGVGRAVGMLALPAVVLTVLLAGYVGARGDAVDEASLRAVLPYLIAVNHTMAFGVLVWLLRREGRTLWGIGWRLDPGQSLWREVLWGLGLALAVYVLKEVGFDSIRALAAGNRPTFTSFFRFGWTPSELPLLAVATTLIAVEESVYRGYGLEPLVRRLGKSGGLVVMGMLFGLLHWGNGALAVLFTGAIGVIFGAFFLWRGTLPAVVVGHAVYNAMVILT